MEKKVKKMNYRSWQFFSIGMLIISFLGITSFINNGEPLPVDKKWKGYMITKDRLKDYFTDQGGSIGGYKKLIISVSIANYDEPAKSMKVFLCAAKSHSDYCEKGFAKELPADPNYAEFPAQENLIMGNTEIVLKDIKGFLFDNTNHWRAGFHHLRLIPVKSHDFESYLAFRYEACKEDGTVISFISKKNVDESNPTPPGRPEQ